MSLSGIDERPGRPLALALAWAALLACAWWAWFAAARPPGPLHAGELMLLFAMWTGLCTSLMLPAVAGTVSVYLRVARRRAAVRWPRVATFLFAFGCLLAWTGFAALVTLLHWGLHRSTDSGGALDGALAAPHPGLGLALVAAGAWQWTPAKHACLQHCRTPLSGVLADWRGGALGPLWQGAEHGRQCLGCCWLLVLLLLAGGPGNPAIVAPVALLALAELRLAEASLVACIAGLGMVALGTLLLFP